MFKLGFVELFRVYFSVLVDMKSEVQALHKRTPLKESTHGTFLKDPIALSARHFAYGEMADALFSRSLPWSRTAVRVTTTRLAARLGGKVDCFSERFTSASFP